MLKRILASTVLVAIVGAVNAMAQGAAGYEALIQQGKAQLQAGSADQSLSTAEQAIKLDAKNWEGYALAGGALMNLKRYDQAITRFGDAMERAPQDKQAGLSELRKQCFAAEAGGSAPTTAPSAPAESSPTPEATTTQAEIVLWKSIENSTNAGDFQSYLGQYPNGAFTALARHRLDELNWNSIQNSSNPADFQSYLAQFPQGEFAALATARLSSVSARAAVGTTFQAQLAWLTQEVAANSKAQFFFLYRVANPWGLANKANPNKPAGKPGTWTQAIAGFQDCVLEVSQHEDRPNSSNYYPLQLDSLAHIPLVQLDPARIRTVDVTDQRDVNGYSGMNGWIIILPAVSGAKPITSSWQDRTGKNLSKSSAGTEHLAAYGLVVNDASVAPKAADLLKQMVQACKAAETGTVVASTVPSPALAAAPSPVQPQTPAESAPAQAATPESVPAADAANGEAEVAATASPATPAPAAAPTPAPAATPAAAPANPPFGAAPAAAGELPGQSETVGVTIAMLPDPPKSPDLPLAKISGPTFTQTLQWMAETAPQNSSPETHDDFAVATYIVLGSTCSKTGFEFVLLHNRKAFSWSTDWITVDLGGIDPGSIVPSGSGVTFGSAKPQIVQIADHHGPHSDTEGRSAADIIKAHVQGKTFKTVLVNNYLLQFGTPEYAVRFANALKHAVQVCGGTSATPAGQLF